MLTTISSRTSSLHRSSNSAPGYFEFEPSSQSARAQIQSGMDKANVHRLDAFHDRPNTAFEYPPHAHLYARRALPALPMITTTNLCKKASTKSLRSPVSPITPEEAKQLSPPRPSLAGMRAHTMDHYNERPLPSLPPLHRVPSLESYSSSRPSDVSTSVSPVDSAPLPRPRAARSISFRNWINRNTFPPTSSESQRSVSSMSQVSDASTYDSRHDSLISDACVSKASTPTSSAPGSRRPSTLSLSSIRARKVTPPSVEAPPQIPASRKASNSTSSGSGRRWNLFGAPTATAVVPVPVTVTEDHEESAPSPITPPPVTELSCHRCYYYSMRNCNGWVMGGSHGDACESCTMHGFFGSP